MRPPVLFRKRSLWVPTLPGLLLIGLILVLLLRAAAPAAYRWLALTQPVKNADYLVFEGWLSDEDLDAVRSLQARLGGTTLYCTGGPIEYARELIPFATWAEASAVRFVTNGIAPERVTAVPAPATRTDRTYTSALALRRHLDASGVRSGTYLLVTSGTHARRSLCLFQLALGDERIVRVHALPPTDYDPARWWTSSGGVRAVVYEGLACAYTRLWSLFRDAEDDLRTLPKDVEHAPAS